jgi:hypothetical protein
MTFLFWIQEFPVHFPKQETHNNLKTVPIEFEYNFIIIETLPKYSLGHGTI